MDLDVLFGTKLEGEMDKYCVPKGNQKTCEKKGGLAISGDGSPLLRSREYQGSGHLPPRVVRASFFDLLTILVPSIFPSLFSMPSWIDLGSIFLLNLLPKIYQNPLKIDAKMASHLDSIF